MKQIRDLCVLLLLMASACSALAADVERPNLNKVRDEISTFESVLNQGLSQAFPRPFEYLDVARGAYLPGYGVIFTFEVNLNPQPPSVGPFGGNKPQSSADRAAAIKKNRASAIALGERALADYAHTLAISPAESVAIIVQGTAAGQHGIEKSTFVLRAQKRDIDQLRSNAISRDAFLKRIEMLEY